MPNLRGFVSGFLADGHTASLIVTICSSLLLLVWTVQTFRSAQATGNLELGLAAALIMAVLVSYHALIYDMGVLFLGVLVLYPRIKPDEDQLHKSGLLLLLPIACLFFAPLQMILWLGLGHLNWIAPLLLLWMWVISNIIDEGRTVHSEHAQVASQS
jgi:hypothetical protein